MSDSPQKLNEVGLCILKNNQTTEDLREGTDELWFLWMLGNTTGNREGEPCGKLAGATLILWRLFPLHFMLSYRDLSACLGSSFFP